LNLEEKKIGSLFQELRYIGGEVNL